MPRPLVTMGRPGRIVERAVPPGDVTESAASGPVHLWLFAHGHLDALAGLERDEPPLADDLAPDVVSIADVDRGFDVDECPARHLENDQHGIGDALAGE